MAKPVHRPPEYQGKLIASSRRFGGYVWVRLREEETCCRCGSSSASGRGAYEDVVGRFEIRPGLTEDSSLSSVLHPLCGDCLGFLWSYVGLRRSGVSHPEALSQAQS